MDVLKKVPVREQDAKVRATNFEEVCLGYNKEEAMAEASRCINCKNAQCVKGCPVSINIPAFIEQGKNGDFVAYFKPNQRIIIPERSFIRKTSKPDAKLLSAIQSVLKSTFITGGYRARQAMYKIAKLVTYRMKSNVKNDQVRNSPLTIKAKGFNSPLVDEKDRIFKAIKYKIYNIYLFLLADALNILINKFIIST